MRPSRFDLETLGEIIGEEYAHLDLDAKSWEKFNALRKRKGRTARSMEQKKTATPTTEEEKAAWTTPAPSLDKEWYAKTPEAERDRIADATNAIPKRIAALTTDEPWPETGDPFEDIRARIDQCADKLAPEAIKMIGHVAENIADRILSRAQDLSAGAALVRMATDALIAQEVEAATRVLGDHGIHHLYGNLRTTDDLLRASGGTTNDRIIGALVATFHDTGYLTDPARAWQDKGHGHWSQQHFDANVGPLVEKAFGPEAAKRTSSIIATHDAKDMDWENDKLASSCRLADNVALFYPEKTPGLFRYVPENRTAMEAFARGEMDVSTLQNTLTDNIKKSNLPEGLKSQLARATSEVNAGLPKFIGGMWSGKIKRVSWDRQYKAPVIHVVNRGNDALMSVLDMGQASFAKMAKEFGKKLDDFKASPIQYFGNPPKVIIRVSGKKILRDIPIGAFLLARRRT